MAHSDCPQTCQMSCHYATVYDGLNCATHGFTVNMVMPRLCILLPLDRAHLSEGLAEADGMALLQEHARCPCIPLAVARRKALIPKISAAQKHS